MGLFYICVVLPEDFTVHEITRTNSPALKILYSELDQRIANGQFYTKSQTSIRGNYEWYDGDVVTWANFGQRLQIIDLDGGTLEDGMVQVMKVPEPAILALLGLGAATLLCHKR